MTNTTGGRKPPTNTQQRQAARRAALDAEARKMGFSSWSRFETLVLHGMVITVHRKCSVDVENSDICHYTGGV